MKLSNIVSTELLPEFAESISWVMNALDHIIQDIKGRSVSIDAPLTMESIEALTDEELQALYAQYGLALYYPDISRARRNWMLYNMARIWRYLGTPKAVEFLCQYIFSDIDIELKVHDNGAFDEEGRLVNPDLVDVFDIEIMPGVIILPPEANQRILENVIRFSRNSQALRQIYYSYDTFVSQTVSPALPYNGIVAVENVLNEAVCEDSPEPPTPPGPTLPTIWQSRANVSPSNQSIAVGGISLLGRDGQIIQYYSDYSYAFRQWVKFTTTDRSPGEIISNAGYLAVKNTGTSEVTGVYGVDYAACSSNQAEVVTVYDSRNYTYNAFKFTSNNTDYYYVLDGTQTDWTDDLSSIGYGTQTDWTDDLLPDYIDVFFNFSSIFLSDVTFAANDYWGTWIIDSTDKSALESFGVTVEQITLENGIYDAVSKTNFESFDFEPIGLYTGNRTGETSADMTNFYCDEGPSNVNGSSYGKQVCIWSRNAYNTSVKTWKCRILNYHDQYTPALFNAYGKRQAEQIIQNVPCYLYNKLGSNFTYSSSIILKGVYNAYGSENTETFVLTGVNGLLAITCTSNSTTAAYCEIDGL